MSYKKIRTVVLITIVFLIGCTDFEEGVNKFNNRLRGSKGTLADTNISYYIEDDGSIKDPEKKEISSVQRSGVCSEGCETCLSKCKELYSDKLSEFYNLEQQFNDCKPQVEDLIKKLNACDPGHFIGGFNKKVDMTPSFEYEKIRVTSFNCVKSCQTCFDECNNKYIDVLVDLNRLTKEWLSCKTYRRQFETELENIECKG